MMTKALITAKRIFNVAGPVAAVFGGLVWMYKTGRDSGLSLMCKWLETHDEVVVTQDIGETFKVVKKSLDGTEHDDMEEGA